ncbi:unnamed protein product [Owenia fusiformis]|uniref:Uncharacterized protein n=1 Tax=Owenia fusiformis TaxID=6347 RepID=A0A8J1V2H8_OWEFU|nr:unnamed protein product [Owenia fusiformis]
MSSWVLCFLFVGCSVVWAQQDACGPAEIVFMLDASGSMSELNFMTILEFTNAVIDDIDSKMTNGFTGSVHIGVLVFENDAIMKIPLWNELTKNELKSRINNIQFVPGKSSATRDAIFLMRQMHTDRGETNATKIAILVTDGNPKTGDPQPEARAAAEQGIFMFVLAITGGQIDISLLSSIATEDTSGESTYFMTVDGFGKLLNKVGWLNTGICDLTRKVEILALDPKDETTSASSTTSTSGSPVTSTSSSTSTTASPVTSTSSSTSTTASPVTSTSSSTPTTASPVTSTSSSTSTTASPVTSTSSSTPTTASPVTSTSSRTSTTASPVTSTSSSTPTTASPVTSTSSSTSTTASPVTSTSSSTSTTASPVTSTSSSTSTTASPVTSTSSSTSTTASPVTSTSSTTSTIGSTVTPASSTTSTSGPTEKPQSATTTIPQNPTVLPNAINSEFGACPGTQVDVIFLLHADPSIDPNVFQDTKILISNIADQLVFGPTNVRVGVITYSAYSLFDIKYQMNPDSFDGAEFNSALSQIDTQSHVLNGNRPDVAFAHVLDAAQFRPGVPIVAIVLTTDTNYTDSTKELIIESDIFNVGIQLYAVGVNSDSLHIDGLELLTREPNSMFIYNSSVIADVNTASELVNIIICNDPVCKDRKVDVIFVVDTTGDDAYIANMKNLVKSIVNRLDINADAAQVGLLQYDATTSQIFQLNRVRSRKRITDAVNALTRTVTETHTAVPLRIARQSMFTKANGDRNDAADIIILVTDVISGNPEHEALLLRNKGILTHVVGIGPEVMKTDLLPVVLSKEMIYEIRHPDNVSLVADMLSKTTCFADACRGIKYDIAVLLDRSSNINDANFKLIIEFLSSVANELDIGPNNTQVAMVTFADHPTIEWDLQRFINRFDLVRAIQNLSSVVTSGVTNHTRALATTTDNVFKLDKGDRPGVINLILMFSDGRSVADDSGECENEATRAKENAVLVVIGVGSYEDIANLRKISSQPSEQYAFTVETYDSLVKMRKSLFKVACTPPVCPDTQAEVAFILENSLDPDNDQFANATRLIMGTVANMHFGKSFMRAGVLTFNSTAHIEIALGDYDTTFNFTKGLQLLNNGGQGNDLTAALKKLPEFFQNARAGVPRVAILLLSRPYIPIEGNADLVQASIEALKQGMSIYALGLPGSLRSDLEKIVPGSEFVHMVNDDATKAVEYMAQYTCVEPVCRNRRADIIFLIETAIVHPSKLDGLKTFVKAVVNRLDISSTSARVGLMTYGSTPRVLLQLHDCMTKTCILATAGNITYHQAGSPNITAALDLAKREMFTPTKGDRSGVPNIIVIVTSEEALFDNLSENADTSGLLIHTVNIGTSSQPDRFTNNLGVAFHSESYSELMKLSINVTKMACYADVCKNKKYDINVVIDRSGSITQDDYILMLGFLYNTVNELNINRNKIQVAVETFADDVKVEWYLNRYNDRIEIGDAIYGLSPYINPSGSTNLNLAINKSTHEVFTVKRGDRSDVQNLLFTITDGMAKDGDPKVSADRAREISKAIIIAIGFGPEMSEQELNKIGSDPDSKYVHKVETVQDLESIRYNLLDMACGKCNGVTDIAIAIDCSGSIGVANFNLMLEFILILIDNLDINTNRDRVGVIAFSDDAKVLIQLVDFTEKESLKSEIRNIPYTLGATNTQHALKLARESLFTEQHGDRLDVPNVILLLTDGVSTVKKHFTIPEALALKQHGVSVVTLAVGNQTDERELSKIASTPELMFEVNRFSSLPSIVDLVMNAICNDENECLDTPCMNNGTCIDLVHGYMCECKSGFSGIQCERECDINVDLIFAIDRSGSIFEENFDQLKQFIIGTLVDFPISQQNTRVGVITFASNAFIEIYLDQSTDLKNLTHRVESISYTGGATNIASALQLIRFSMFRESRGDRLNVPNVLVIITDGASSVNTRDTLPQARILQNEGVHITVVGIGHELKKSELRGLATDPDRCNVMVVDDFKNLAMIRPNITKPFCYDQHHCEPNHCRNGAVCSDKLTHYVCDCVSGFTGQNCSAECPSKRDIVFILDASGSMGSETFDKILTFVKKVTDNFDIESGTQRVGLVAFASEGVIHFELDKFSSSFDLLNAIGSVEYTGGSTNTADGIAHMMTMFSTVKKIGRSDVDNLAILITDGVATVQQGVEFEEALKARDRNIHIKAIGIGSIIYEKYLEKLASKTTSETGIPDQVIIRNVNDLDNVLLRKLIDEICDRP